MIKNPNISFFLVFLFYHNIVKQLLWPRGLDMYTNKSRSTHPNQIPIKRIVTPLYEYSKQNNSTSSCGLLIIYLKWPPPISYLITTQKIATDANGDENYQYFSTPKNTIAVPLKYVIQILILLGFDFNYIHTH